MAHMMISGVARSGTTALYTALHKTIVSEVSHCEFFYEPYLWTLGGQEPYGAWASKFSSTSSYSIEGIYCHKTTPLFLREDKPPHSDFVEKIFDRKVSNVLAKFIRASGRMDAYLLHSDKLKVVHICRNPIATINSAVGLFSFFGDEIYPSDKARFIQELSERFGVVIGNDEIKDEIDWAINWWKYMNRAALESKKLFGDRVLLISQEQLYHDHRAVVSCVCQFFGLDLPNSKRRPQVSEESGPTTPKSNLTQEHMERIRPAQQEYWGELYPQLENIVSLDTVKLDKDIVDHHHSDQNNVEPVCLEIRPDLNPIELRSDLLRISKKLEYAIAQNKDGAVQAVKKEPQIQHAVSKAEKNNILKTLRVLKKKLRGSGRSAEVTMPRIQAPAQITCIVTSYNQSALLKEAVLSVLSQTLPIQEILICDDASEDDSRAIIQSFEKEHTNVRGIFRERNVGPGLNRHLAILQAANPFITQLDGDDRFGPKKLEKEWKVLSGSFEAVAFSDIEMIHTDGNLIMLDTRFYSKDMAKADKLRSMLLRQHPVPRDMLFSKDLYVRTGGYEADVSMYEDWGLKLRLLNLEPRWRHSGEVGTRYDRTGGGLSQQSEFAGIYWQLYCIERNLEWLWRELEPSDIVRAVERIFPEATRLPSVVETALSALPNAEFHERLLGLISALKVDYDKDSDASIAVEKAVKQFSKFASEILPNGSQLPL